MSETTEISWSDATFNPWIGCAKVSPACLNCYAEALCVHRFGWVRWGRGRPRRRASLATQGMPFRWDRKAAAAGTRTKVFCASLADVFDAEVNPAWRADLWDTIRATPNLDWLLLTKRPENIRGMLPVGYAESCDNVWLGTSVESQDYLWRAETIATLPAAVHFLSVEPMLAPVDLRELFARYGHLRWWIICGGESGPGARPMEVAWVRDLRDQCLEAGIPFHFKQWGGSNKKIAGRLLDGRTWDEFPTPRPLPPMAALSGGKVVACR
jgi:protein gp37